MRALRNRFRRGLAALLALLVVVPPERLARAVDLGSPGVHAVGFFDLDVPRPDQSTFRARLLYPALAPGQSAAFDATGGPYPVISFGHGYLQTVDRYESTFQHLASHGYFVIAPIGHTDLIPDQAQFAQEMRYSLDYLVTQNATSGSMFFGGVASEALGVSGHSMGGAASIRVAAEDARIRAVANLAAANTFANPSPIQLMASVTAPINLLAGSDDLISPPNNHQIPMYNNGFAPKMLTTLQGGSHAYFQDSGPAISDGSTMPRAQQLEITRRELTTFFNFYLKEDESLWREVWGPEAAADPLVNVTSASGIGLVPDVAGQLVVAGQTARYQVTVTNHGRTAAFYDLFADDQAWSTTFSAAATPLLNPGESAVVTVEVATPDAAFSALDQVLISARSSADGLTRGWTRLTTSTSPFNGEVMAASTLSSSAIRFDTAGNASVFADAADGLLAPFDVVYNDAGELFVADVLRSRITRFDSAGVGTIFADLSDGVVSPAGLAVTDDGTLYVSNYLANTIVRLDAQGNGILFADAADGLSSPFGIDVDGLGNLYVADFNHSRVLKFDPQGNPSVFADAADGLFAPFDVAVDLEGNVYVADVLRSRVTRFTPSGEGAIYADGTQQLLTPSGLAFDALGNLFVSNYLFNNIIKISPDGQSTTFANLGDGLRSPFGLAARSLLAQQAAFAPDTLVLPEPSAAALAAVGVLCFVMIGGAGLIGRRRAAAGP